MIRTGFHYRVEAEVTFTGFDLAVMFELSRAHYDGRCQATFQQGGFGYGWLMQFLCDRVKNDSFSLIDLALKNINEDLRGLKFDVTVTSSEIDRLRKIIEAAEYTPLADEHMQVAAKLMVGLGEIFREMNDESRRLHGRA